VELCLVGRGSTLVATEMPVMALRVCHCRFRAVTTVHDQVELPRVEGGSAKHAIVIMENLEPHRFPCRIFLRYLWRAVMP